MIIIWKVLRVWKLLIWPFGHARFKDLIHNAAKITQIISEWPIIPHKKKRSKLNWDYLIGPVCFARLKFLHLLFDILQNLLYLFFSRKLDIDLGAV